ncbi:hypothetical protein [Paenibacillus sabinae]|nr:hypothetical protein [Paenibacillus sabinae]
MMNSYEEEFLKALELEDSLPGTTKCQKEANEHRRRLCLHYINKRQNDEETTYTDLAQEMHINKAIDPSYRLSIFGFLK